MKVFLAVVGVICFTTSSNGASPYSQFYPNSFNRPDSVPASTLQQASVAARPARQSRYQGGGGGGGGGSIECQRQEVGPGRFKFVCEGVSPEQRTIRNEHILWLTSDGSGPQVVDIEVPNYKISELIKAGYKTSPGGSTKINVLLRKPEQSADAEVDVPKSQAGSTSVNLEYEQPVNQLVHFPNDKQYRPLSGPILPPLASGRGRRDLEIHQGYSGVNQQQQQPNYWY